MSSTSSADLSLSPRRETVAQRRVIIHYTPVSRNGSVIWRRAGTKGLNGQHSSSGRRAGRLSATPPLSRKAVAAAAASSFSSEPLEGERVESSQPLRSGTCLPRVRRLGRRRFLLLPRASEVRRSGRSSRRRRRLLLTAQSPRAGGCFPAFCRALRSGRTSAASNQGCLGVDPIRAGGRPAGLPACLTPPHCKRAGSFLGVVQVF